MILVCCVAAKGFYLKYDEMKTDANVQKWDVHVLTVSYFSLLIHAVDLLLSLNHVELF